MKWPALLDMDKKNGLKFQPNLSFKEKVLEFLINSNSCSRII